jgi:hypothetical protein
LKEHQKQKQINPPKSQEIEVVLGRKQTNPPKSQDIEEVLSQKQTNPLQRDNFFFLN